MSGSINVSPFTPKRGRIKSKTETKVFSSSANEDFKNNEEYCEDPKLMKDNLWKGQTLEPDWPNKDKVKHKIRSVSENETTSSPQQNQEKSSSTSPTIDTKSQSADYRETLTCKSVSISKSVKIVDLEVVSKSEHRSVNGETIKAISAYEETSFHESGQGTLDPRSELSSEEVQSKLLKKKSPDPYLASFQNTLKSLGLENYYPNRLGLNHLKQLICSCSQSSSKRDWSFLENLLLLDVDNPDIFNDAILSSSSKQISETIEKSFWNNQDALTALFMCSDLLLRRRLAKLLQAWSLPVPFILPTTNEILLWSFRTYRVSNKVCLASSPFPFVSVIQFGDWEILSPSKLLNAALGDGKSQKLFTETKNSIPVCEGMVEINCHFPKEAPSTGFNFSVMAAHLLGNGQSFTKQFKYLAEISDIVCIILKDLSQVTQFLKSFGKDKRVLILVNNEEGIGTDLYNSIGEYKVPGTNISVVKYLHDAKEVLLSFGNQEIANILPMSLEKRIETTEKHGFYIDEDNDNCKKARSKAREVFVQLQKADHFTSFRNILMERSKGKLKANEVLDAAGITHNQLENALTPSFRLFLDNLKSSKGDQLQYFLDWLKLYLTNKCRPEQCDEKQKEEHSFKTMTNLENLLQEVCYYWTISESIRSSDHHVDWIPEVLANLVINGHSHQVADLSSNVIFAELTSKVVYYISNMVGEDSKLCVVSCIGTHEKETVEMLRTVFGTSFSQTMSISNPKVSLELLKVPSEFYSKLTCQYIALLYRSGPVSEENGNLQQDLIRIMSQLSDIVTYTLNSDNESMETTAKDLCSAHYLIKERAVHTKIPQCFSLFLTSWNQESSQNNLKALKETCSDFCHSEAQKSDQERFSNPFASSIKTKSKHLPKFSNQYLFSQKKRNKYLDLMKKTKSWMLETVAACEFFKVSVLQHRIDNLMKTERLKPQLLDCSVSHYSKSPEDLQSLFVAERSKVESRINKWVKETETKILSSTCILKEQKRSIISEGNEVIDKEISNLKNELKNLEEKESAGKVEESIQEKVQTFGRKLSTGMLTTIMNCYQQLQERIQQNNGFIRGMTQLQKLHTNSKDPGQDKHLKEIEENFHKLSEIYFERGNLGTIDMHGISARGTLQKCLRQRFGDDKRWLQEVAHPSLTHEFSNKDVQLSAIYRWTIGRYQCTEWVTGNLYWKVNLQRLSDKILKQSGRDVQALSSKPALLTEDHCEKVISNVEKRIEENQDLTNPWSLEFKFTIMNIVCNFAVPAFQDMVEQYRTCADYQQAVDDLKESYKSLIFKPITPNRQAEIFQKEIIAGILVSCRKRLPVIITECLKEENKQLFSIKGVYKELLAHIKEKHKFEVYMSYISDFKGLATSWIRTEIIQFLEEDVGGRTRFLKILLKKTKLALKALKTILKEAQKEADGDYGNFLRAVWMKALSKNLELGFDNRCVKRLEFLPVTDLDRFINTVEGNLMTDTLAQVSSKIQKLNVEKEIRNADPRIEEQIYDVLMCSEGAQCPFCGSPCTKLGPHSVHSTEVHYPQGINGYRDTKSKQLVFRNCYESFSTNKRFTTEGTKGKTCSYTDYRRIHPDWEIKLQETHLQQSQFWKKFFHAFNQQLADYYDSKPAVLPK